MKPLPLPLGGNVDGYLDDKDYKGKENEAKAWNNNTTKTSNKDLDNHDVVPDEEKALAIENKHPRRADDGGGAGAGGAAAAAAAAAGSGDCGGAGDGAGGAGRGGRRSGGDGSGDGGGGVWQGGAVLVHP